MIKSKGDEMGSLYSTNRENRNAYRILIEKPERKKTTTCIKIKTWVGGYY
jgi:hypothetical protein